MRTSPTKDQLFRGGFGSNDFVRVGQDVAPGWTLVDFDMASIYFTIPSLTAAEEKQDKARFAAVAGISNGPVRHLSPWVYQQSITEWRSTNPHVWSTGAEIAAGTKFAAFMWPLMIKALGVGAGFAPSLPAALVAILITEMGEEGVRQAEGEKPRSAWEIVEAIGTEAVIAGIFHFVAKGVDVVEKKMAGKAATAAEAAERFERQAAAALREQVERSEGPLVDRQLRQGRARKVGHDELEVKIDVEGNEHTYHRDADGTWCRHSNPPVICETELGGDVDNAADDAARAPDDVPPGGLGGAAEEAARAQGALDAQALDAGGGHGYSDHGVHVTAEQQERRLWTTRPPSNRAQPTGGQAPRPPEAASNFLTDQAQVDAAPAALCGTGSGPTTRRCASSASRCRTRASPTVSVRRGLSASRRTG